MTPQPSALAALPCPFCGTPYMDTTNPSGAYRDGNARLGQEYWTVRCGNPHCGAEIIDETEELTIASWNKRWPTQAQGEANREDILSEFAMEPGHSVEMLKSYLRRYPQFAEDLVELSFMITHLKERDTPLTAYDEKRIDEAWSKVSAARKPPKHDFWGAGEKDCPREIKAGNGELHTLMCKRCGEKNPPDEFCWNHTHPSPSTAADDPNTCVLCKWRLPDAALREALRNIDEICAAAVYPPLKEMAVTQIQKIARALLAGDNREL